MWVGALLLTIASAKVLVFGPETLLKELRNLLNASINDKVIEVPSTLANFGNPPYGSELSGRAVYLPMDSDACRSIDPVVVDTHDPVPILLADRGACPFVMKARHAQDAGYRALVVVDLFDEALDEIIMTDNGTGGNIEIPVLMISKTIGSAVKEVAKDPAEVVEMKLTFEIEKRETAHLRVVYSSENAKAGQFFGEFAQYAKRFNNTNLNFRPHFALWYCIECNATGFAEKTEDCISGGRYCAPDPDGLGEMTGRDVIMEDLRQICLLRAWEKSQQRYSNWFEYMAKFNRTCRASNISEKCSKALVDSIDSTAWQGVSTCVQNSIDGTDIDLHDNKLMRREVRAWLYLSLEFYPAIVINKKVYRGDWEGLLLAQSICASYLDPPEFCGEISPKTEETWKSKTSLSTVILVVALSLLGVVAVLMLYRVWMKRETRLETRRLVDIAMSQYYALNSEGSQLAERSERK